MGLLWTFKAMPFDPYRRLAAAIVQRAVIDIAPSSRYKKEARLWFLSKDSEWILDYLEITETARVWVRRGCPRTDGRLHRKDKQNDRDWSKYYLRKILAAKEGDEHGI